MIEKPEIEEEHPARIGSHDNSNKRKVHKKYFAPDWIARTFTKSPIQKTSNFFWKKVSMSFSYSHNDVKLWKLVQTQQTRKEACVCGWNPVLLKGKYFVCWNIFPFKLFCRFHFKYFVAKIFFLAFGSEYQWASLYEPWMTWELGITQEIHTTWL